MKKLQTLDTHDNKTRAQMFNEYFGRIFGLQIHTSKYRPVNRDKKIAIERKFDSQRRRQLIELEHGVYDPNEEEFFLSHDAGLFSCLSVTLWSICDLIRAGIVPKKINFQESLAIYKDNPGANIFPDLFEAPNTSEIASNFGSIAQSRYRRFDHHGIYGNLDFPVLSQLVAAYFKPNENIKKRTHEFCNNLSGDEKYVGVWIRGTDKAAEVPHTDSSMYIEAVENIISKNHARRVFIQTDQSQIHDLFMHRFAGVCDAIEVLPRVNDTIGVHKTSIIAGQRVTYAQNMLAAVSLISSMPYIVTHTGNIGAWISMTRDSVDNLWQATPSGIVLQSSAKLRKADYQD